MISEQGIVEEITGKRATVRIEKSSSCEHCSDKDSCTASERNMIVDVENTLNAKQGDQVELSVPEGTFIKLSLMVYMSPIIALMAGAFLGNYLSTLLNTNQSATAAITGALFLVAAFIGLKIFDKNKKSGDKYTPRMTRIVFSGKNLQSDDSI